MCLIRYNVNRQLNIIIKLVPKINKSVDFLIEIRPEEYDRYWVIIKFIKNVNKNPDMR